MHAQVYSCIIEADSLKCNGLKKSGLVSSVVFQTFVGLGLIMQVFFFINREGRKKHHPR